MARARIATAIDRGVGIPEEHRSKIFEGFHRVPGNEKLEGTGLGLSIVRQLVKIWEARSTSRVR